MATENCIFCKLVAKEIPSNTAYEDDFVYAFHDLTPKAPVHVLVIPKQHLPNIAGASDDHAELLGALILAANNVAALTGIDKTGYRVVANVGKDGGQSVDHLHLHVLGGRSLGWPPG